MTKIERAGFEEGGAETDSAVIVVVVDVPYPLEAEETAIPVPVVMNSYEWVDEAEDDGERTADEVGDDEETVWVGLSICLDFWSWLWRRTDDRVRDERGRDFRLSTRWNDGVSSTSLFVRRVVVLTGAVDLSLLQTLRILFFNINIKYY